MENRNKIEAQVIVEKNNLQQRIKAEEALHGSKEFSEKLIEIANAIVVTLDENANIFTFNKFAEKLTGYKKEEVQGKNWFNVFIPERDKIEIPSVFKQVLEDMPEASSYKNPIVCKNGEERLIEWKNSVLKDKRGIPTGVLSIGIDITESFQAEQQQKLATQILEVLNNTREKVDVINDILYLIQKSTNMEAVAIRLEEGYSITS